MGFRKNGIKTPKLAKGNLKLAKGNPKLSKGNIHRETGARCPLTVSECRRKGP